MITEELPEGGSAGSWSGVTRRSTTARCASSRIRPRESRSTYFMPGISSVPALAARHRIALNRIGAVHRHHRARLAEGCRPGIDDVVVMLDAQQTFARLPGGDLHIYWGAYLGTPDELLVHGDLRTSRRRSSGCAPSTGAQGLDHGHLPPPPATARVIRVVLILGGTAEARQLAAALVASGPATR